MAVFDIAVVYVALPDMERSIGAGISDQQWIASAYGLMEAGFTLAAGTLGDLWGRKRVLVAGVLLFACASIGSGLAPNPVALIVARFVQGIGGAIMMTLPLAMLAALARDERERDDNIRMFATVAGLGAVAAPLAGGVLVELLGWRAIFFVNVPLALFVLYAVGVFAAESTRHAGRRLDSGGQLSSALALIGVTFVSIEGTRMGPASPPVLIAALLALVSAIAFVTIERRSSDPMLNFTVFRQPFLAVAAACIFVMNAGFFTVYLLSTLFLQNVKAVDALTAGWLLLGNNIAFFVANLWSGSLAKAIGKRAAGLGGLLAGGAGIAMYAGIDERTPAGLLVLPLVLTGLAWGSAMTPLNALAMSVAPEDAEGLDASLLNLGRPLGAVLATAIFGSIIAAAIAAAPAVHETRASGFVAGMHRTAVVAAALTAGAFLIAWFTTRRTPGVPDGSGRWVAGSARP